MSSWAWMEGPGRAHPTPTPQLGQVWRPTAGVLSPSEGLSSQEGTPGWAAQSRKPHALCRTPVTPQGALGGQLPPAAPCKHTACEKPPARGRTRAVSSAAWRTRGPCLPPLKTWPQPQTSGPTGHRKDSVREGDPAPLGLAAVEWLSGGGPRPPPPGPSGFSVPIECPFSPTLTLALTLQTGEGGEWVSR